MSQQLRDRERITSGFSQSGAKRGPKIFPDQALVRQLIYEFRNWSSLEAVGRMGNDEGIDIRGTEQIINRETTLTDDEEAEFEKEGSSEQCTWIIQCKRERSIGPTKIAQIVSNNVSTQSQPPYGYMLVAACDFSKKTRDAFRAAILSVGVEEYFLWGKAEIEDQLFLPKNDDLLFVGKRSWAGAPERLACYRCHRGGNMTNGLSTSPLAQ